MASLFRDRPFPRLFLGLAALLALLAFISLRMAWTQEPASALVGTYHPAPSGFLPVADLPGKLVLREDGTMEIFDKQGRPVYEGPWRWDEKEGVLLTDSPRWDRQVRMRNTLDGPRLCMRPDATPILYDEAERDEEVDLIKAKAVLTSPKD